MIIRSKYIKGVVTSAALLFALTASAQDVLKSQIVSVDKSPIEGAIVSVKGGAPQVTDKEGNVDITAKDPNTIVTIKAPGFFDCELPMMFFTNKANGGKATVVLVPRSERIYNGTLSNSFGEVKTAGDNVTSTQGMSSKDFSDKLSVGAAIGNGVAGLQMIEKSGMPGEGTYMNIRGIHSIVADNSPLIVINGIPYFGNTDVSEIINGYSRDILAGYDPKDIRSITVLKGSDAAQWGSLGSNGVILIETQTANSDNLNTKITFSGQYGMSFAKPGIQMMDATQYKKYAREVGLTLYPSLSALVTDYPFLQNAGSYTGDYLFNENNNWMNQIQRGGFSTDNQLRVEGGDEIAKYNISFGYTKNDGTLKNTSTDRYHTLISANVLVTRNIDIFANVALSYQTSNLLNTGTEAIYNPITSAMWNMPLISYNKKQADGQALSVLANYNEWNVSSNPMFPYNNVSNPIALVDEVKGADKMYDANANLGINFRVNPYLSLQGMANIYYNYVEETMFIPGVTNPTIVPGYFGKGNNFAASGVIRQMTNTYQASADYKRTFANIHDFRARVAARWITRSMEVDGLKGYNTPNDYLTTLGNVTDGIETLGGNQSWNYIGFGINASYVYNRLWSAKVGINADGTSASGAKASRIAVFPSAGLTFMIANTGWLPSAFNKFNVSIEGSYSGNSRFSSNYSKDYFVGSAGIGGIKRENLPNTKLTWEMKRQLDFGLELSMFNNRFDFGFNYYTATSYDLLINNTVSPVYGSQVYYDNTGKIDNNGLELALRGNIVRTRNFDFTVGATLSRNLSRLKSLGGIQKHIVNFTGFNDDAAVVMEVGKNPYCFYGYQTKGIYSTTEQAQQANLVNAAGIAYQAGDVIFVDQNGDGIINDDDKVAIGSATPDLYGALNVNFRYKKLELLMNFGYSVGNKAYNYTRRQAESMSTFYNQSTGVLNRWQVEGQDAKLPRAVYGDPAGNNVFSDRWIEDASYFKLRSIKLAYNFNKFLHFINSGTVWVAAENLFTVTKYLGGDPEFAYGNSEAMRGFDYAKVSLPRTVKIGIDLNF